MAYYDSTPNEKKCQINSFDDIECNSDAIRDVITKYGMIPICDEHYELALKLAKDIFTDIEKEEIKTRPYRPR